jgi:hypothetical protein
MQRLDPIIAELERNHAVFRSLLVDLPQELVQWRPSPEKWTILEIVCHLRDEESEDFRLRTKMTLENPDLAPPSIAPESWVLERTYAQQDYATVVREFLQAREMSIQWLRSLEQPQWENAWVHPKAGPLKASFFLQNWLAHDYLHLKQILQRKFNYLQEASQHVLDYAGTW